MIRRSRTFTPALVALGIASFVLAGLAMAQEKTESVTLTFTVVTSEGKPAPNVAVKLLKNTLGSSNKGKVGGGGPDGKSAFGPASDGAVELESPIGKVVATTNTDASGVAVFRNVKPGQYNYSAGTRATGLALGQCPVDGKKPEIAVAVKLNKAE